MIECQTYLGQIVHTTTAHKLMLQVIKSAEKCKTYTVQAIRIKNLKSKNKYLRILKISQNNNKKMKKKQYNIKVDTWT